MVISIHGGPESQYRPYFWPAEQYYLNELGLAVIHPNVRGSAGYGKTYLQLDNAALREDSVRDIGALLDWIAQQPELDAQRVAVTGGSYGGYMVLASLVHFGDRLRAGVDHVGIANFITFLERTSPYRQDLRRAEYGDERDPAMRAIFERISPLANADKIRSALMLVHGRNDPRVPFSEALQIAAKVRVRRTPRMDGLRRQRRPRLQQERQPRLCDGRGSGVPETAPRAGDVAWQRGELTLRRCKPKSSP